jgi:RNA polymerase sigma-54 factor
MIALQMGHRMAMEQLQQIKMTPEMKVSIDILQTSSLELAAYLQEVTLDNPVLDIEIESLSHSRSKKKKRSPQLQIDPISNVMAKGETLQDYVVSQLRLLELPNDISRIVRFLAGNLDEIGYLMVSLEETAQILNTSMNLVEKSLTVLQSFEPSGIGARSLKECLLIQIEQDPNSSSCASVLVEQYLRELGMGKYGEIAEKMHISSEEVTSLLHYIQSLNPRPGLLVSTPDNPYIIADAEVIRDGNRFIIRMMHDHLPRLTINPEYTESSSKFEYSEAYKYLKTKLQDARIILRSLEKRKATLSRVLFAIFEEQQDFLQGKGLKPINLKTVSLKTGLHISTISRAVKNKYIQTPHGIFELSYFFSGGIYTSEGFTSNKNVHARIKDIIDAENKRKPLSDQQITNMLNEDGYQISRRTVTKYREEMKILSTLFRRK